MDKENFSNKPDYEEFIETSSPELKVGSEGYILNKYGMTKEDLRNYLLNNPKAFDLFEDELEPLETNSFEDEELEEFETSTQHNEIRSFDFGTSRHRQVEGQINFNQMQEETPDKYIAMDLREYYQAVKGIMADFNKLAQARGFLQAYSDAEKRQDFLERYGSKKLETIRKGMINLHLTLPYQIQKNVFKLLGDAEEIKQFDPEYNEKAHYDEIAGKINRIYGTGVEGAYERREKKIKKASNYINYIDQENQE